jgi:hypothetical protein
MTQLNVSRIERTLNQFVVQWNVTGAFTGSVLDVAPGLATSSGVILPDQQDEDGVFQIDVDGDLGILDPDALGALGGSGDRYMQWIRIEAGIGNIPPGFSLRIVDASGLVPSLGVPLEIQNLVPTAGNPTFYRSQFYLIPQGCALEFNFLPAPPAGSFNRIKIGFKSATSAREDAQLQRAMCCQAGA